MGFRGGWSEKGWEVDEWRMTRTGGEVRAVEVGEGDEGGEGL